MESPRAGPALTCRVSALVRLPCCGCSVCKDERKLLTRPCRCPQPAGCSHWVPGQMQVVRAEVPLAAFTPALGAQHNSSSKSFLIQAGTWCLQTSVTAKTRAQCFALDKGSCRVSASAVRAAQPGLPGLPSSPRLQRSPCLFPGQKANSERENEEQAKALGSVFQLLLPVFQGRTTSNRCLPAEGPQPQVGARSWDAVRERWRGLARVCCVSSVRPALKKGTK